MSNSTSAVSVNEIEIVIADYEVVDCFEKFTPKKKSGKKQWSNQDKAKHSRKNARKGKMTFNY